MLYYYLFHASLGQSIALMRVTRYASHECKGVYSTSTTPLKPIELATFNNNNIEDAFYAMINCYMLYFLKF